MNKKEPAKVLNKHKDMIPDDAVYIGRGSPYGNIYTHLNTVFKDAVKVSSREEAINRFKVNQLPRLDLTPLIGKDLVCFCSPLPCHGHAILEEIERRHGANTQ